MKNYEIIAHFEEMKKISEKRDMIAWNRGIHTDEQMKQIKTNLRLIDFYNQQISIYKNKK